MRRNPANEEIDIIPVKAGYSIATTGAFNILGEIIIEEMNQYVQANYWPKNPLLADLTITEKGYPRGRALFSRIVERVAEKATLDPNKIWLDLFKGALVGDMKALRIFAQNMSNEDMRTLAHYKENSPEQTTLVARKLGLTATLNDVEERLKE